MDRSEWVLVPRKATAGMLCGMRFATSMTGAGDAELALRWDGAIAAAPPPPAESEGAKAFQDMLDTGTGVMLDGKRIAPERVRVVTPPPAEQGCKCECHRNPSIQHFVPCCTPPAEQASWELLAVLREMRDTGDVSDWRAWDAALDAAIAALSQRPVVARPEASAPVGVIGDAIQHLSKWLDLNECECEDSHQCGRAEVERTRDQLRALAPQQPTGEEG